MKKILWVAAMLFVGMFTYCYGQDVNVNINNRGNSTNVDGEFRINGISSSEDIGGVDLEFKNEKDDGRCYDGYKTISVLTNYNAFPVTVLFKVSGPYDPSNKTLNVVIGANGTKRVEIWCGEAGTYSLEGMIVRKLKQ